MLICWFNYLVYADFHILKVFKVKRVDNGTIDRLHMKRNGLVQSPLQYRTVGLSQYITENLVFSASQSEFALRGGLGAPRWAGL